MNKNKTNGSNNINNCLKIVIFDEICLKMPYFDELITSLKEEGINVIPAETGAYGSDCLYICGCREGIERAKKNDTAFVSCGVEDRSAQCIIEGFDEVDADFIVKMYQRKHGIPWKICETERLLIREFSLSDKMDIFSEKAGDPDYNRLYIENIYGFFGYGIWAVVHKDKDEVIGKAGLMNSERTDGIELGYEIFKDHRNNGYAFEACRGILDISCRRYGLKEVYAFTDESNVPSKKLLKKLGFVKSGIEENIEKYMFNIVDNAILRV